MLFRSKIKLTQGKYAIVDDEDYINLSKYNWVFNNGYAVGAIRVGEYGYKKGGLVMMHRQILSAPENMEVDHRNHDRIDNRKENLRVCTRQENMMNKGTRNGRKFKGISFHKISGKWSVVFLGKWIGYFDTPEKAAREYDKHAKEHYKDFASLNFPEKL